MTASRTSFYLPDVGKCGREPPIVLLFSATARPPRNRPCTAEILALIAGLPSQLSQNDRGEKQSWLRTNPKGWLLSAKNAAFTSEVLPQMLGAG
jgi:hypothetical protein